jgi:hypothetical protein
MVALTLNPIYEDEVFRIGIDKQFAVLELTFLRHPDAAHFRNAYNLAFGIALSKNVKYWLTDATQIKVMERENQAWLVEKMTPLLNSNQIRRFAIVLAPECFVMTNPNQVYEKPGSGNKAFSSGAIRVHFDKDAAYEWIFSSKETSTV